MEYIINLVAGRHFWMIAVIAIVLLVSAIGDCFVSKATSQVRYRRSGYFFAVLSGLTAGIELFDLIGKWFAGEFDLGSDGLTLLACFVISVLLSAILYGISMLIIKFGYTRKRNTAFALYLNGVADQARRKDDLYLHYRR